MNAHFEQGDASDGVLADRFFERQRREILDQVRAAESRRRERRNGSMLAIAALVVMALALGVIAGRSMPAGGSAEGPWIAELSVAPEFEVDAFSEIVAFDESPDGDWLPLDADADLATILPPLELDDLELALLGDGMGPDGDDSVRLEQTFNRGAPRGTARG